MSLMVRLKYQNVGETTSASATEPQPDAPVAHHSDEDELDDDEDFEYQDPESDDDLYDDPEAVSEPSTRRRRRQIIDDESDEERLHNEPSRVQQPSYLLRVRRGGFYHCDFVDCDYRYRVWGDLVAHFRSFHKTGWGYCCPHPGCDAHCRAVIDYEEHTRKEHDKVRLPRVFVPRSEVLRRRGPTKKPTVCVHCQKKFSKHRHMVEHMGIFHSDKRRWWRCTVCEDKGAKEPKQYRFKRDLKKHIRKFHKDVDTEDDIMKHIDRSERNPVWDE